MDQADSGSMIAAKSAPPIAYVTATLAGVPVETWISYATLLYLACMIASWVWANLIKPWQASKCKRRRASDR